MARHLARVCRYLWALPTTLVGLLGALWIWTSGGCVRWHDGIIEACGGAIGVVFRASPIVRGGIAAMALGHVVLAVDDEAMAGTRAHERVHVRQAERWGPFFIPAYLAASTWQFLCGRDPYRDNPFEREAFECERQGRGEGASEDPSTSSADHRGGNARASNSTV